MNPVDVAIVGSGAAGSLLAAKLAQSGKSVVIFEAGPERTMQDLVSSQIWARRMKWAGPATLVEGKEPISVGFNTGWGTGGAAMHHYACWLRLHEEDFGVKSRFGRGLDWPLSYNELRPYYDQIQREVGISGDARTEIWRPAGEPYPMPPLQHFAQGQLISRGFEKLGMRTSPLPMAINSVRYNGRAACVYDGWCDAGCPIGALANPLAMYLPQALKAGARIVHDAFVSRVLNGKRSSRAGGVEYFDARARRQSQQAKLVVLAAFAFQNPRILLQSREGGLANSSGLLGRYIMGHSSTNIWGLFHEDTQNYLGMTGGQLLNQDSYAKDPRRGYPGSYQWLIGNALKPNDLLGIVNSRPELFGDALHGFLKTASRHIATMTLVGENLPDPESRLVLSERKDRFGLPLARVVHDYGKDDIACYDAAVKQGLEVFRAAGAYEAWAGGRVRMHVLGGAIMGRTAKDSVTNSYGQTHDVANLFVAGSSLFPTSGAVNPTFTIHALALRTAGYMIENWSSLT